LRKRVVALGEFIVKVHPVPPVCRDCVNEVIKFNDLLEGAALRVPRYDLGIVGENGVAREFLDADGVSLSPNYLPVLEACMNGK
jgi:hypothetical protein